MLKKFLQYASGNFLALILGFISSPIITRIISPEEMGKFSLFNTVTSVIFLFSMIGTDQSYVRFYNSESEEGKCLLLKKCVKLSLLVGAGTSIGIICFYKELSLYIYGEISIGVIALLIANIFTNVMQRFSILEIRMALKAKLYSIMSVWQKLSYILMVFAVYYWLNDNSYVLMIAAVVSNLSCSIVCICIEHETWFKHIKGKSKLLTGELLKYGFPFIFSNVINWIFEYMDRLSIRQFCDFSEVGIYSAASTIVALLTACQMAFSSFWVPVAYEKYENDDSRCKEFFIKMNRIVSFAMLVVAFGMIAGKDIIIYLLGNNYRDAMYIFPFLTFMPIMYTVSETTVMGINFCKKTRMHIVIAVISALCNLIGNTLLVPQFGARGAAISTGFSYVVFFLVRTIISLKLYSVHYKLKSLFISLGFLCVLAVYSSFHTLDYFTVIWTGMSLIVTGYLFRDVLLLAKDYCLNTFGLNKKGK